MLDREKERGRARWSEGSKGLGQEQRMPVSISKWSKRSLG
jgi:hypothetical protein